MAVMAFVLVDAIPGNTDRVYASLEKLRGKGMLAKGLLRVGNFDILVKLEATDDDALDDFIASNLRFISGVKECRRIGRLEDEAAEVQAAIQKLA